MNAERRAAAIEHWLPIPGYEGKYEVSDQGRVRSLLWGEPRLRKPVKHKFGYPQVMLAGGTQYEIHRLVLLAFVGPLPAGHVTRHLDGDVTNATLSNLTYGTASENNLDQVRHGTHWEANQTHCHRGHPFDDENTIWRPQGRGRDCRTCKRERDALRQRRWVNGRRLRVEETA